MYSCVMWVIICNMKILFVEDNEDLSRYTKELLEDRGYVVETALDGAVAQRLIDGGEYDVIILDILLPHKTGTEICADMRATGNETPVIMLTTKSHIQDKVDGLHGGANDYIVKPCHIDELDARIQAVLRGRVVQRENDMGREVKSIHSVHGLRLDYAAHAVYVDDVEVALSLKEYAILEFLLRHQGTAVSKGQILDHCWDGNFDPESNIVEVYIRKLRHKIKEKEHAYTIKTIRGVGYRFDA